MAEYLDGGRIQGTTFGGATFYSDLAQYSTQTAADTAYPSTSTGNARVNIEGNVIDFKNQRNASDVSIYKTVGTSNIGSTWTLDFDFHLTTKITTGFSQDMFITLSSSSAGSNTTRDAVGIGLSTVVDDMFCVMCDGTTYSNGVNDREGSFGWTNGTTYYARVIKDGDTVTANFYSNSSRTAILKTSTIGGANSLANLQYFQIANREENSNKSGTVDITTISKIALYNGTTSPPSIDEKVSLSKVPIGTRYEEIDTRKIFLKGTHGWKERNETTYDTMVSFRGCFCGGQNSTDTIDYITIETTGDATDFGDLTGNTGAAAGCDNNSRGIIGHGSNNIMDYITIGTAGNATDFGDRNNTGDEIGACSDQTTRGIFFGGTAGSRESIDYITIATAGNATDFGDMTDGRSAPAGLGDTTRGCMGGGSTGSIVNIIDYITIATTGNATDFGDLTQARRHLAATASETRGVFAGGHATYNNIDYITIQTAGNATDFGDLVNGRYGIAGVSNYARGVFGSSNVSGTSNQMDYITIATVGNATDFGDLTVARSNAGGVSGN